MPLSKFYGSYSLTHSDLYYKIPRGDYMYSYWIVETHCDKIPLAVVGYKNHQSIKKQILTHFPDTINITYIHEESSNEIRIRSHIQNLIQERDQETKQNIIDSINDDIEYYENQIRVMVDSE